MKFSKKIDELLGACQRQEILVNANSVHVSDTFDGSSLWKDYTSAAENDLYSVLKFWINHLGIDPNRMQVDCVIDSSDFEFDAYIRPISCNKFQINVSIGLFLALDDWSMAVSPYYHPETMSLLNATCMNYSVTDPEWKSRFWNYSECSSRYDQLFGVFSFREINDISRSISNLMLSWALLHEIGHSVLGHLGPEIHLQVLGDLGRSIITAVSDKPPVYEDIVKSDFARELHCDFFATVGLFSLLELVASPSSEQSISATSSLNAELIFDFMFNSGMYMSLLIHKSELGKESRSNTHPWPLTRCYNGYVTIEFFCQFIAPRLSTVRLIDLSAGSTVLRYQRSLAHMYYCSALVYPTKYDPTLSERKAGQIAKNNLITRDDTVKWILSIWNSRYASNFFVETEGCYKYVDEWFTVWKRLISSTPLVSNGVPNPTQTTIFDEMVIGVCMAPTILRIEAMAGFDDEKKSAKYFSDIILICDIIGEM